MTPQQIAEAKRMGRSESSIIAQHAQDLSAGGVGMAEAMGIASDDVANIDPFAAQFYTTDPQTGGTMSKADQDKYIKESQAELNELASKNEQFAKLRDAAFSSNDPGEIAKAIESSDELRKAANEFAGYLSTEQGSVGYGGFERMNNMNAVDQAIANADAGVARLNVLLGDDDTSDDNSGSVSDAQLAALRQTREGNFNYPVAGAEFGSPFLRSEFVGRIDPSTQLERFASFMPVTTVSPEIANYMQETAPELITSFYAQGAGLPGSPYAVTPESGLTSFEKFLGSGTRLTPEQMRQYSNEVNTALLSTEAPSQRQQFLQATYASPLAQRNLYEQALGSGTAAATKAALNRMVDRQYRQQQFQTPGQAFLPTAGQTTPYQDPRPGLIGQPFDADDYVNPFEQFMVGN